MYREEIGWECVEWVGLTLVPSNWPDVVNAVMNSVVLRKAGYMQTSEGNGEESAVCSWVDDNIQMFREEIGWECVELVGLTLVRSKWPAVVNAVMNPGVLRKTGYMQTSEGN